MTFRQVITLMVLLAVIALVTSLVLSRKSYAAEPLPIPLPCQEPEATAKEKTLGAAERFTSVELETLSFDKIWYFEAYGMVWQLMARKGCTVFGPIPFDYPKDRGVGT